MKPRVRRKRCVVPLLLQGQSIGWGTRVSRTLQSVRGKRVDMLSFGAFVDSQIEFLMVERLEATRVESGRASVVVVRPGRNGQGDRAGRLWAASHGDTASQYGQAGRHGEVDTARARRQGRHGQTDTARSTERARPVFQVSPQFSKFPKPFGFRQNGWAISLLAASAWPHHPGCV